MSTSLQHIVGAGEGRARQESIEELFVRKDYAVFEVESLRRHPLFQSHDHFRFFLDILDEWNRKAAAQETPAHCDALFRRNAFLFNSLRSAALRPLPAATRSLAALFAWFTRARTARRPPSRPPAPAESDWHIRNTFKSNLPAEIGLYRRREFWGKEEGREGERGRKVKTEGGSERSRSEVEGRRLLKIEHEMVRQEREREEMAAVGGKWKAKKAREEEANAKDFYRGHFSASKTYFQTPQRRPKQQRLHTSTGTRNRYISHSRPSLQSQPRHSQAHPSVPPAEPHRCTWTEEALPLREIDGLQLLNNPFEKKLKKRKRRS